MATTWQKALDLDQLADGRVTTVTLGTQTLCMTHYEGKYGALDNACPHQGGPLGEGSIENGLLRCPWHGWDYHPCTGLAPGFDDGVETFPLEVREDGVYVALPEEETHVDTISDRMVETMVNWGVDAVFGMVGHSNLGFADAMRRAEERGDLRYFGIRHEGAAAFAASAYGKLTGELAACFAIAGPGATNLLTGLYDAKVDRAPVLAITGQVQTKSLVLAPFKKSTSKAPSMTSPPFPSLVLPTSRPTELMNLACKHALIERGVAHIILPDETQEIPATDAHTIGCQPGAAPPQASLQMRSNLLRPMPC